ncbi:uncharacterized protein SAPINGB_P004066 [Magnusiomyces paraingens]|uniref:glutamine--tRNA ligase n=1 Tax=Magnusiomyces paraingens TaxID=2606893 RepID=A0A5E8BUT0_9ASCO|nr:uncharacterized protein SAPINGB_P004066 [Saprochaete ingens]VVT54419.1 unnamed protein product [Saprochaete ingens]
MSEEDFTAKFAGLGLEDKKIKEIVKNKKVATALAEIADELPAGTTTPNASTLHSLATLSKDVDAELKPYRKLVTDAIADGSLKTNLQLDAAWKYVVANGAASTRSGLDEASGVGIVVTEAQVEEQVAKYIADNKASIEEQRYKAVPSILVNVKNLPSLKWASPALFKPIIDKQVLALLGPKDDRDLLKKKEKPKKEKVSTSKNAADDIGSATSSSRSMFTQGFLGALHKPGGNPQVNPEFMKQHLAFTGGKVYTRFPPEPNGYLHIGHSKAITVNFGYAKFNGGKCYLRYDDTNPDAEEEQFFTSILEIVRWLGFEPFKITYSSDYFDHLYELAEHLIKKDLGYVCFCTAEEMKHNRGISEEGKAGGERKNCAHHGQSVEENLKYFRDMKAGKYKKGEAVLRMKQDITNPNPQMWDLVAYRVVDAPHHRTGDKWKIYPTYDFTHCLVDSFENISHSLCTTEFYLSRESYEWLCDAVDVYKPAQREYGRLNITGTVMSKRKIAKLVEGKYVRGWDDPRLFTLVAIRRRGIPPGAVLSFVAQLGVTTTNSNIQVVRFESSIRKYLEDSTPRLMMIPDPVPVILENLPENHYEEMDMPFKPGSPEFGEHKLPFTRKIYVDRSDFREEASKDYFRLAPGQSVGLLKVPYNIRVTSYTKDEKTGLVTEIRAHYENDVAHKKPKTYIQWIADAPEKGSPIKLSEVRLFEQLFKSDNPAAHPDGFLADINENSETVLKNAIIDTGFWEVKKRSPWKVESRPGTAESDEQKREEEVLGGNESQWTPESVRFQALRVGYFCMDRDSVGDDKIVLNRIVTLKEDSSKSK